MVDFNKRLKEKIAAALPAPSMVPNYDAVAPPPKQEEKAPDLRELIADNRDYLTLRRLIEEDLPWKDQEAEAKKQRKVIETKIKALMGKHKVGSALMDDIPISYFSSPRSSLDKGLLLSNGVSPQVILASMKTKVTYTLRIGKGKTEDNGGDDE